MQTLPSGSAAGLVVVPFRGVRYNPHRASGIANVTSPPYDVISGRALDELLTADPHNIVRLILPARSPDDADDPPGASAPEDAAPAGANEHAARRLRAWLDSGVLAPDPEPALYVYEQSAPGWLQRGLIGLVAVGTPESAGILPHEDVMPGPVRDRRDLMAATRANLEPIFLVYNGGGRAGTPGGPAPDGTAGSGGHRGTAGSPGSQRAGPGTGRHTASLIADLTAERHSPLVTAVTPDGITHRLWRLTEPAEHVAIGADLATRPALIADGHHRYAAYRDLRDLMRRAGRGGGPWDYGLAFLVDADAYPPRLGAIHRVIPGLPPDRAAGLAAAAFTVRPLPGMTTTGAGLPPGSTAPAESADDLEAALDSLAEAGQDGTAFLLAGRPGYQLLTQPDRARLEAAMPAGASRPWRELDAAILQELLLAWAWGIRDNERDVLVFHDAGEAVRAAVAAAGTAVISNPVAFAAVADLAARGERVPRKSTSFGPKPRSGLVLRTFSA